jgi:ribosome-binding protein aMBF1 (putative translation factor)
MLDAMVTVRRRTTTVRIHPHMGAVHQDRPFERELPMSKPKTLDPPQSTRALYGAELRHRRESAGMSQEDLGGGDVHQRGVRGDA